MWNIIPESVKDIHKIFKSNNKKLYVVGGAVRDFITGDVPKDFDLATDALPDEVVDILGNGYRTNLQGKAFGVLVVYTKDEPMGMEIATFRSDLTKGRNPKVKLGVTIKDDVKRRDLSINGLFFDLDTRGIIDLVGGISDLKSKIIKTVGIPSERFSEDSLRILRVFRFATRYNSELHSSVKSAIKINNSLENLDPDTNKMKRISQERIWEEMEKSFKQAKNYNEYLNLFTEFDMWDEIFPGASINTSLVISDKIEIIMANLFKSESFNNAKEIEKRLVQDYKIPNDLASTIVFLNRLLAFNVDLVFDIYKKREQLGISDDILHEWLSVNKGADEVLFKFIDYKPSISSEKLMSQGFSGRDLGIEIRKKESEAFKK